MNSREEILHLLAPLTSILRMPDDLIGILAVARRAPRKTSASPALGKITTS